MDDQEQQTSVVGFSYEQEVALRVLESCSASLSVIGSTTIVYKILRDRSRNGSTIPYERIMLGLSSCDILSSTTWAIDNLLHPRESGHVGSFGNLATCQLVGFLIQVSISAWWYNCMLSYYFLLTVLSQVKRKNLVGIFEPWMHLSVLFFPITAIVGLLRGWYNTDGKDCWIKDEVLQWSVAGGQIFFTYFSLIINNIVIYAVVRKSLQTSENAPNLSLVQKRLKREAVTVMLLYVACFFITVSPVLTIQILEVYSGLDRDAGKYYYLWVFDAMFKPLQGFFNCFIYIRPMYTRFRAAYPNKSIYFVLHQSLFNPKVPRKHHRRVANRVTHGSVGITDISFGEDTAVNPNQALFDPGVRPLSSSSVSSLNNIAEASGHLEESKEDDSKKNEEEENLSDPDTNAHGR